MIWNTIEPFSLHIPYTTGSPFGIESLHKLATFKQQMERPFYELSFIKFPRQGFSKGDAEGG